MSHLPLTIQSPPIREGHVQGIAVDTARGFVYYSFTTLLLKTDLDGNVIGSVVHLAGHLGCITFDEAHNRVLGSLEMKHDSIGKGIISRTGWDASAEDAFYLVSFACDKIDRENMNAETDDVMTAVYLADVVSDYESIDEISARPHRYGCSGIDGTALGPLFGDPDGEEKIMIAYGIYQELDRCDNDHQVILSFDPAVIDTYGKVLNQSSPHHSGPLHAENRFFLYTGNTTWGIQNLEYDPFSKTWFVCVYEGKKPQFENFPLFFIDGRQAPARSALKGRNGEQGLLLTPAPLGIEGKQEGIRGAHFPHGSTGIAALGDGTFYISHHQSDYNTGTHATCLHRYRLDPTASDLFVEET